ncbi:MAG: hypothetical protein NC299_09685 [Lachnospiraceae bacterium]|nr:hypothetical protein [Ruminococcus sp.]MCM1275624.1 hypothetical protein [Lachnospiraceae bacterium]
MYRLTRKTSDVLEITFDYMEPVHGYDPFKTILREYSARSGIQPKLVDYLYNFKFTEDGYKIQFYWNGCFSVYIFYISKAQFDTVYGRLTDICAALNKQILEWRRETYRNKQRRD